MNTVEMVQGHTSTNQESFRVISRQSESGFIAPHHFIIRKVLCSSSDSSSAKCSTSLYHRVLSRKTLGLLDLHWLWLDEPLTQFGWTETLTNRLSNHILTDPRDYCLPISMAEKSPSLLLIWMLSSSYLWFQTWFQTSFIIHYFA